MEIVAISVTYPSSSSLVILKPLSSLICGLERFLTKGKVTRNSGTKMTPGTFSINKTDPYLALKMVFTTFLINEILATT